MRTASDVRSPGVAQSGRSLVGNTLPMKSYILGETNNLILLTFDWSKTGKMYVQILSLVVYTSF